MSQQIIIHYPPKIINPTPPSLPRRSHRAGISQFSLCSFAFRPREQRNHKTMLVPDPALEKKGQAERATALSPVSHFRYVMQRCTPERYNSPAGWGLASADVVEISAKIGARGW